MELVWLYFLPMVMTVPVTYILCRLWRSRAKIPSYGTLIAAPCVVVLVLLTLNSGGRCFTYPYWSPAVHHKGYPGWPLPKLRELGFIAAICALPALAVVAYFQSRRKHNETKPA
jgi:MFS superfamily sulfate permease-like transporter